VGVDSSLSTPYYYFLIKKALKEKRSLQEKAIASKVIESNKLN